MYAYFIKLPFIILVILGLFGSNDAFSRQPQDSQEGLTTINIHHSENETNAVAQAATHLK